MTLSRREPNIGPVGERVTGPGWQFWIDRGGTFTDIVARDPDGHLRDAQAAVGESRPATATPPWPGSGRCSASAPTSRSRRPRSIRSAWARPSPPTRCSSARASAPPWSSRRASRRRAADRLPEPPADLRPPHRAARAAPRAGDRSRRAGRRGRHGAAPARPRRLVAELQRAYDDGIRAVAVVCMHGHLLPRARTGHRPSSPSASASPRSRCRARSAR